MKWKYYPKYKDSGVVWLGDIPEHWQSMPLFSLLHERNQKNIGNSEENVLSLSYGEIIQRDVSDNFGLLPESFETYQIVEPNHIILRLTDLQNDKRSLRVGLVTKRGIITSAYVCLEAQKTEVIDTKYIYYLLHAYDVSKVYYSLGGGVRQSMKFEDLKWLPIVSPSLSEQRAIAVFLNREIQRIDQLIARKERQIELLQEKRSALISHAVTKGLNPKAKMKDSGIEWLGDIPEHWNIQRLKYVSTINDETLSEDTDPLFELLYIDIGSVDSVQGIVNKEVLVFEKAPSRARRIVRNGDIIVSTVRTYLRAIAPIVNPESNLIVSTGFAVVRPRYGLESHFAAYALRAPYFVDTIVSRSVGVSYPAINASVLTLIEIALPPLEEQRKIALYLAHETGKIDAIVSRVKDSIDKLREYRTALISAAVTGKIDVRKEAA